MSIDLFAGRPVDAQPGNGPIPFPEIGIEFLKTIETLTFDRIVFDIAAGIFGDTVLLRVPRSVR